MKLKIFVLATGLFVFQHALEGQTGNFVQWVGVWEGQLDGKPGVTVTLGRDSGDLEGTIVFNVVARDNGEEPHVIGHDAHVLTHANLSGSTLAFHVIRMGDARELHLTMRMTDSDKAVLECADRGGPGHTELNRIH
jgi:hypothetical protein